jgi:nitrate/TMAO reductase-like tetraheme cytochrome c subunit
MIRRLACLCVFVLAGSAGAQDAAVPANPHGDADLDCASCHAEAPGGRDRVGAGFDHATTGFPLEGAHTATACRDCHDDPVFAHVGIACADCHADPHRGRLGPSCDDCHHPGGWIDREDQRRQHDGTALPLTGAHASVDCEACHSGPVSTFYVGTPTDCYACHAATYEATTAPPHLSGGLGTDCLQCHTVYSTGWSGGDFRHPASFPLTHGHAIADCNACHTGGFAGTPTDCIACHQADYDRTTDPDHALAGFPTDCRVCHNTRTWDDATMDHDATAFPLTGSHRGVDCLSCHATGYQGTPTDCYACHQARYDATTEPPHATSGFNTDCAACHTTTDWEPSTWDHDVIFPIYSGRHRDEWNACIDCHVVPTDYRQFECILCHEHNNQTDVDNDHSEVRDYEYLSRRCYECHPRGEKD